ncbi:MAG: HNH endonuclease signature motif containing protein, partial [Nanoarchaeota archaeon]
KQRIYEQMNNRKKIDPQFAIKCRLRSALYLALKYYTETGKIYKSREYGIDYDAILKKLGNFPTENRKDWHIDHIRPLNSFDLTNPEEIKKAFAPENLQWLPAKENISKGNRYG